MLGSLQIHSHDCSSALRAPKGKVLYRLGRISQGQADPSASIFDIPLLHLRSKEGPSTAVGHQSFCTHACSRCVAYTVTWRVLT